LLIKHRDDWAGEVDIVEFAPRSVKSDGDFEDILAADQPDVWKSNRPAKGGEAGEMLAKIIERAARLKAGERASEEPAKSPVRAKNRTPTRSQSKPTKSKPATTARKRTAASASRSVRRRG
jgi:hypothetical protein